MDRLVTIPFEAWMVILVLALIWGFWLALVIEYWRGHTIGGCEVCQSGRQKCPHCGGLH